MAMPWDLFNRFMDAGERLGKAMSANAPTGIIRAEQQAILDEWDRRRDEVVGFPPGRSLWWIARVRRAAAAPEWR